MSVPLKQVIEALVFASPKPLQIPEIVSALQSAGEKAEHEGDLQEYAKATPDQILPILEELRDELAQAGRGYMMVEQVNGWTLATNPDTASWVRRLYPEAKPTRLSGPALETLAIIAYRQPVTRADMEAVRGVAVDGVMQVLLERGLVKISGRAEVPGRPLLYSTTEFFLQHFGLKTVDELPNAGELRKVDLPSAPIPEAETAPAKPAEEAAGDATNAEKPEKPEKPAKARRGKKAATEPAPTESAPAPASEASTPAAEAASPAPEPTPESTEPAPPVEAAPSQASASVPKETPVEPDIQEPPPRAAGPVSWEFFAEEEEEPEPSSESTDADESAEPTESIPTLDNPPPTHPNP